MDPLALLGQLKSDITADTSTLQTSHTAYQSVFQQQTVLTDEIKACSRKIGEAKKQNLSIDNLKAQTRAISLQLRPLTKRLKKLEEEILVEFTRLYNHDGLALKENDALINAGMNCRNRYRLTETTPQAIAINVIDTNTDKSAKDFQRWNQYVLNHAAGTIHHQIDWQHIMHQPYGHTSYYFYASTADGSIVGILPIVRLTSKLFGDLMVSMPFFQRGGAIADNAEIENQLMESANKNAQSSGVSHIEYRDDISHEDMSVTTRKVNMVLTLPESNEGLWDSFSSKLRSQIKRPLRENPQKNIGGLEYLDDFYKVYTRNMRDLGSPVHSKDFIKAILESFPENSWLVIVYHNNRAVAAALLLAYKDTMEIPLASTIRDANRFSMNMFLYWEVLKFATKNKYKYFDFGRSSLDSGTYRFKQQWGAKPKQLYWHYWLADGVELPKLNPDNPKYALAITIWKRLPIFITKWLGPLIVRNLP